MYQSLFTHSSLTPSSVAAPQQLDFIVNLKRTPHSCASAAGGFPSAGDWHPHRLRGASRREADAVAGVSWGC
ncbi:hypothetical protein NIES50_40860 [Aulosira laxa NIES-50]|nr:hypothetical protein NIES50_40860 [Aulosira laxa NIES-50]